MSHVKVGHFSKKQIFELPDGTHCLEKNLYLRVRANGKYRNYFFRYTDTCGQSRDIAMGSARKKPLIEVKQLAYFFRTTLEIAAQNNQIDFSKERPLFKEYATKTIELLATVKLWKNPAQKKSWLSSISTYAIPRIGEKFVDEIDRNDVLNILRPIWKEKTMTASRLRGRLEKIFSYAIHDGLYIGMNPASWNGNLEMFLPPVRKFAPTNHFNSLSFPELKGIIPKLIEDTSVGAKALLFGVLTATRTVEFTQAHWREINWKERIWYCPASRRKDGKEEPFRVPLSLQAMELLKEMKQRSHGEFIFSLDGLTPIRRETPRKYLCTTLKIKATMHGMRSTFRDWCAENDIENEVAEKSLMHSTGNQTTVAYQRSDLLEKRRAAVQRWADALINVVHESFEKADSLQNNN